MLVYILRMLPFPRLFSQLSLQPWFTLSIFPLCQTAYLAASVLIDPNSELNILLTATIQADLRSDNFLTVCTALQAIPTIANVELANVFLPEVMNLVQHDRDQVKKRALITLHSLLRVDPSIGTEIGKVFVDKLAYKEPSVMFSVLPALYELINEDPEPYKGLVHYFTDILKQASEGKLGRNWVVHKAPAPFLQITLLRLLGSLGKGDPQVSKDMQAVLIDVWKRAQSLMNHAGNAILFECMKTATIIVPSDALYSIALDTAAMFLNSTDNNLKCAGIEIFSRIVEDGDSGKVQQYQMAIVAALRSSDVTLKGRTLDLLFRMTGANNIDVVFSEVLEYITDDSIDEDSRKYAASQLLDVSTKFSPSLSWFVDSMTTLLKKAGIFSSSSAQNALVSAIRDGDQILQHRVAHSYFETIEKSKVSVPLAKVICWTLGEYGLTSGISFESLCNTLMAVLESYNNSSDLSVVCIMALAKLNSHNSQDLPAEVVYLLRSLQSSKKLEIQQTAFEALSIAAHPAEDRRQIIFKKPTDASLPYLDDISAHAATLGSAPYISKEDRYAMDFAHQKDISSDHALRFEAYERQEGTPAQVSPPSINDLFGDVEQQDIPGKTILDQEVDKIHVMRHDDSRRWGSALRPNVDSHGRFSSPEASPQLSEPMPRTQERHSPGHVLQDKIDAGQELLAASLFAGSGANSKTIVGIPEENPVQSQPITFDLLDMASAPNQPMQPQHDIFDLLGENPVESSMTVRDEEQSDTTFSQKDSGQKDDKGISDPFESLLL